MIFSSHNYYEETPTDKYIAKPHVNVLADVTECIYISELLSSLAVQKEKK